MLDDLKKIHERDQQDALGIAEKQWQYLTATFSARFSPTAPVTNIVLSGMGGSALPGVFLNSWPGLKAPFEIARGYSVPPYVDEHTLFISSSYSGNTEETLEAIGHAAEQGAQIVVVAAGGKLRELAIDKGYPLYEIPAGIQPRMATFYFLNAFVTILEPLGLTIENADVVTEIAPWLQQTVTNWLPTVATKDNLAKQIALELMGKTVIMYGGPLLFPAANKWKICMNENAKNTAWVNQYSEFNHNEFIGWSGHPLDKPFAVVEIRSELEHPRIQKRFEVSERLLSGKRPAPIVVRPEGSTLAHQLAYSVILGDFVSIYLALLNGINPTPVDLVERLKADLDK